MNLTLKRLGFAPGDRVAIVHADDLGMCQATVPAVCELLDFGLVTSASLMVPCPWFDEAAEAVRGRPAYDVGVHTTLTAEWARYRWAPLTRRDSAAGLVDAEGFMPRGCEELWARADRGAAAAEMAAQLRRALDAGVDVTHVDSHMGAAFGPGMLDGYLELARAHGLPAMQPRTSPELLARFGIPADDAEALAARQREMEEAGIPLVDEIVGMPLGEHEDRLAVARRTFDALPAGLSYVILHPAADTPELRAIAPDWRGRAVDVGVFASDELRDHVRAAGIQLIGWRPIRDLMRSQRL